MQLRYILAAAVTAAARTSRTGKHVDHRLPSFFSSLSFSFSLTFPSGIFRISEKWDYPILSHPLPSLSFSPSPSLPPIRTLEAGPLNSSYWIWKRAVSFPSEIWDGAPTEIEFFAFYLKSWWQQFERQKLQMHVWFPVWFSIFPHIWKLLSTATSRKTRKQLPTVSWTSTMALAVCKRAEKSLKYTMTSVVRWRNFFLLHLSIMWFHVENEINLYCCQICYTFDQYFKSTSCKTKWSPFGLPCVAPSRIRPATTTLMIMIMMISSHPATSNQSAICVLCESKIIQIGIYWACRVRLYWPIGI